MIKNINEINDCSMRHTQALIILTRHNIDCLNRYILMLLKKP